MKARYWIIGAEARLPIFILTAAILVALLIFNIAHRLFGGEASPPMTSTSRALSDSLSIIINNPGPDTLWIAMLARDEKGAFFTSRPRAIAPGARFSVEDRTDILRGFRLYEKGEAR